MLRYDSCVCYKEGRLIMVRVEAKVIDPRLGTANTTNVFFLTFRSAESRDTTPDLMISSYADAILMLEGRRRMKMD